MKKGIELYGTVIVTVLILIMLLAYFFNRNDGFLGQVSRTPPSSELGSADESALLEDVAGRAKPALSVTVKKLKKGKTYDLAAEFVMKAVNADDQQLPVEIEKMTYQDGTDVERNGFTPQKPGIYTLSCSAQEEYRSFTLRTEESYKFTVD